MNPRRWYRAVGTGLALAACAYGCGDGGTDPGGLQPVDDPLRPPTGVSIVGDSLFFRDFWGATPISPSYRVQRQGEGAVSRVQLLTPALGPPDAPWATASLEADTLPTRVHITFPSMRITPARYEGWVRVQGDAGVPDSLHVRLEVRASSRLEVALDTIHYILEVGETASSRISVDHFGNGPASDLSVTVTPGDWLSAQVEAPSAPTTLVVTAQAGQTEGLLSASVVRLEQAHFEAGGAVFYFGGSVETPPDESRDFDPLCWKEIGMSACAAFRAHRWRGDTHDIVALDIQNLQGSFVAPWDSSSATRITGVGLALPDPRFPSVPVYLGARTDGPVGKLGTGDTSPEWLDQSELGALAVRWVNVLTTIMGCGGESRSFGSTPPLRSRRTCPASGLDGWVRLTFQVPSATWSLAEAEPYLRMHVSRPEDTQSIRDAECRPFSNDCTFVPRP